MRFDRTVLIIILLVLPVAFWPSSTSYDSAKFTLLAVAGACWLGNLAWRLGANRPILRPPVLLIAAGLSLLVVIGVSALRAYHVGLVFRTVLLAALWLAVVFQTAVTSDHPSRMRFLLTAAVGSGVIVSLYGLAQITGLMPGAPVDSGYPPGISTLGNQNYLAGLAAVLLWPSVILWSQPSTLRRAAAVIATVILAITIIIAMAMGPVFAVVGSFFLVMPSLVLVLKGKSLKVPLVLGASLVLAAILGSVLLGEAMRPSTQTPDETQTIHRKIFLENHGALRRTNWLVAKDMFLTSPWTGHGAGNYKPLWPTTRAKLYGDPMVNGLAGHEPLAAQAHNEVFQLLGETGLAGGLWLVLSGGAAIWYWRRRWRDLPDRGTRSDFLLLTASLLAAGIHGSVSFPLHIPATALALAMVVGLMVSPSFSGIGTTPSYWKGNRTLAMGPAALALVLFTGSLQEFAGDLHIAEGQRYFAAARLNQASFHLAKGVKLRQWPGAGNLYLGLVRVAGGDLQRARPALENSVLENPTFEGFLALAELSIDQGKFGEASRILTIVEDCEPFMEFRVQAAYLRGLAELRQGHFVESRRLFGELLVMDPDNQRAWLALGYQEVLEGRPGRARVCYLRALEIIEGKLRMLRKDNESSSGGASVRLNRHMKAAKKALKSTEQ
jgi:O-antigen ligase